MGAATGGRSVEIARCEYDYDGEPDNGLPPTALARKHLVESISEWGDGDVLEGFHTRDMCALLAALDRIEALANEWAEHTADSRGWASARVLAAFDDPHTARPLGRERVMTAERERAALAGEPGFCRHLNPERTHMCDLDAGHTGDCYGFELPTIELAEGEL